MLPLFLLLRILLRCAICMFVTLYCISVLVPCATTSLQLKNPKQRFRALKKDSQGPGPLAATTLPRARKSRETLRETMGNHEKLCEPTWGLARSQNATEDHGRPKETTGIRGRALKTTGHLATDFGSRPPLTGYHGRPRKTTGDDRKPGETTGEQGRPRDRATNLDRVTHPMG